MPNGANDSEAANVDRRNAVTGAAHPTHADLLRLAEMAARGGQYGDGALDLTDEQVDTIAARVLAAWRSERAT